MDYESEQAMEMEALEAILMDDMEEYEGTLPEGWNSDTKAYRISIKPADDDQSTAGDELEMDLLFAHTPSYPDEAPHIKLRSVCGLSDSDMEQATALLQQQVEANMGMAMIFTLVTAAQEWLQERLTAADTSTDPEADRKRHEQEDEARRAAARAHGTAVTLETFLAWKRQFDAEMALQKAALADQGKADGTRITGKAWFLGQAPGEDVGDGSEADENGLSDVQDDEDADDLDYNDDDDDEGAGDDDEDDDEGFLDEYLSAKQ
eukprot:jgi/Chrzof1/929/Cz01g34050.t1